MLYLKVQQVSVISSSTKHDKEQQAAQTEMPGAFEYSRFITYRISQLSAKLNKQASQVLQEHVGLNMVQWRILALVHSSGPVSSATLVKAVGMDAGLFSRNLKSMQELKLVKTTIDKNDHRKQILTLSKAGREYYKRASPVMDKRRENLTRGLSSTELAALHKALDTIERNTRTQIK